MGARPCLEVLLVPFEASKPTLHRRTEPATDTGAGRQRQAEAGSAADGGRRRQAATAGRTSAGGRGGTRRRTVVDRRSAWSMAQTTQHRRATAETTTQHRRATGQWHVRAWESHRQGAQRQVTGRATGDGCLRPPRVPARDGSGQCRAACPRCPMWRRLPDRRQAGDRGPLRWGDSRARRLWWPAGGCGVSRGEMPGARHRDGWVR